MCKEGWKWISFHGWIQPLYLLLLLGTQCLLASPLWKKTIPSLSCQFCVFMFFAVAARLAVILGLPVCSTRLKWLPYLDFKTQNRNVCWPFNMPLPMHRAVLAWSGSGWSQEYFAVVCCGSLVRSVMGNLRGDAQKSVHRLAAGCRLAASETEELHLKEWEQF